jgi:hypothetical protein
MPLTFTEETMIPTTTCLRLAALLLWLVYGVVACAPKSQGVVRVPRSYGEVVAASLAAIQEAEFAVTSPENGHGTIMAEKHLPRAEGGTLRMTVSITQGPTGLTVVATVLAPAGPLATGEKPCKCHVKRFVEALEHRLPEVQVLSIQ